MTSNNRKDLVLALDQGTTSSRSIIFDRGGLEVGKAQREFSQIFPKSGWVEHDPEEIWESQLGTAVKAIASTGSSAADISAIGITNQRETTLVWDRNTGEPVMNAIVWQDRRTSDHCLNLRSSHGDRIREKTGLETDPYFSATKIAWILDNVEGAREKAEAGDLAFGTVDSWLVWKLTGGAKHVTDVSNASRTLLFNIGELSWDDELLELFRVPAQMLPEICGSSEVIGEVSAIPELNGIPISGIAGDQQAALFGQRCFEKGSAKCTYGTGCFLLQNTGNAPVTSKNRLLTTVGWQTGENAEYALEGSVFIGGAVVQWLRDSLGIISTASEIEALAGSVEDSEGVHFVPAFAGLGTPYWDPTARGLLTGLTRGTGKAHIARAALDAIAFQVAELIEATEKDSGVELPELRVDGGASANPLLMQIQSDLLQRPVVRSDVMETTALGAAYLAGLATGVWKDREEIGSFERTEDRFEPAIPATKAEARLRQWKQAVQRSLNWQT